MWYIIVYEGESKDTLVCDIADKNKQIMCLHLRALMLCN